MRFYILNMIRTLFLLFILVLFINCKEKLNHQEIINEIESNKNMFDLNFTKRGNAGMFYNDSISYSYLQDSIETISSSGNLQNFGKYILIDYKLDTIKQKIWIYKKDNSYSLKIIYLVDKTIKQDSSLIAKNDKLEKLFNDTRIQYNFYLKNNITSYHNIKKFEIKIFGLSDFNQMYHINTPNLLNDTWRENINNSIKIKENWYLYKPN